MSNPNPCSWSGVFPAATTQFDASMQVDLPATQKVQKALLDDGVHGLVLMGTVGEGNSLARRGEAQRLAGRGRSEAARRRSLSESRNSPPRRRRNSPAMRSGSAPTGSWCCRPWCTFRRPPNSSITLEPWRPRAGLPIMLYNNPPSYRVNIDIATLGRLADVPNIVAIKESAADSRRFTDIINAFGERFVLFAGLDDVAFEALTLGAKGWVSGLTNAFPVESLRFYEALRKGDLDQRAQDLSLVHAAAASGRRTRSGAIDQAGRIHHGPRFGARALATTAAPGRAARRGDRDD